MPPTPRDGRSQYDLATTVRRSPTGYEVTVFGIYTTAEGNAVRSLLSPRFAHTAIRGRTN